MDGPLASEFCHSELHTSPPFYALVPSARSVFGEIEKPDLFARAALLNLNLQTADRLCTHGLLVRTTVYVSLPYTALNPAVKRLVSQSAVYAAADFPAGE